MSEIEFGSFEPFHIRTCERKSERPMRLGYRPERPWEPFEIHDPFGLRKAVVPVFRMAPDGRLFGMGTAFHADGWGKFLTADHVTEFVRQESRHEPIIGGERVIEAPPAFLLLGVGVVFGSIKVPDEAVIPVHRHGTPMAHKDDPLAQLNGKSSIEVAADICLLETKLSHKPTWPLTLPISSKPEDARVGDYVLAVGYPRLDCRHVDKNEQITLLEEGMFGAYGRIHRILPGGRDITTPTPVYEVVCDWPGGMSGGPVFNRNGIVIGIVSRSLRAEGKFPGIGWATNLSSIPELPDMLTTLDLATPGWRVGWGALPRDLSRVDHVFESKADAEAFAATRNFVVIRVRNEIGSDWYSPEP